MLGLNAKIQTITQMVYGFRHKGHFKTAIYFHYVGLDLYPCEFRKDLICLEDRGNTREPYSMDHPACSLVEDEGGVLA